MPFIFIGTHDIQNISVTFPTSGELKITGYIIDRSNVTGMLAILYSKDSVYYLRVMGNNRIIQATLTGLSDYNYISVFEIEENGLPFHSVATKPISLTEERGSTGESV